MRFTSATPLEGHLCPKSAAEAHVAAHADNHSLHVAFAIGRRVGGAVVRNRLRRRLRAALRSFTLPGGSLLISVSPAAAAASFQTLQRDLWDALGPAVRANG